MEKDECLKVKFRDVAPTYFPQTRVECRYTLSSDHRWSCRDWIGLFQIGWRSVRDYHTYAWAPAPENNTPGKHTNCSIVFHPSYLPNPGATAYQFLYVDELEEICAVSSLFTFSTPKPLDDLVTLEEERNGEEENEGEDLLLVVPRAQILQTQLEACQEELLQVQKQLRASSLELEQHRQSSETERKVFEMERAEMKNEIEDLQGRLRFSLETIERKEEKEKRVFESEEKLSEEMKSLISERAENQQRVKELEDDMSGLMQQRQESETELHRMKERVKKLTLQRKAEEDERRNLQVEVKRCHEELQVLQERLETSDCSVEVLRRDLSELGALQSQNQAELHQVRLQAAQTALQLSQANLNLREGQAGWAKERENLRRNSELDKERVQKLSHELQKKEEWLEEERTEREKLEQEIGNEKACNRELQDHIRVFRLRMDNQSRWNNTHTTHTPTDVISSSAALQKSDVKQAEIVNLLQNKGAEPEEKEELDEEKAESMEEKSSEQETDNCETEERTKDSATPENQTSDFADAPLW